MSAPPFMQLYVSDYLGDTLHLTTEQHGAYMLLLLAMWNGGGDLPADPKFLCRVTRCTASRWARIGADVMAFFTVENGRLTNARLGLELKKAQEKSIQRAVFGSQGGKAKALKDNKPALAKATGLPCHLPEPEPDKSIEAKASHPVKPGKVRTGFDLFWGPYPLKVGKKAALKAWLAAKDLPPVDAVLAAVEAYKLAKPPDRDWCHPATWLNQGRWMDEHEQTTGPPPAVDPARVAAMTAEHKARQRAYLDEIDAAQ